MSLMRIDGGPSSSAMVMNAVQRPQSGSSEPVGTAIGVSETPKSRSLETPPLQTMLSGLEFPHILTSIAKVPGETTVND